MWSKRDISWRAPASLMLSGLAGSCFAVASVPQAADPQPGSQPATSSLQEVVITAEKRQSTVEATPISITALTGKDIQERGITDVGSIVQSVPGVAMRTSGPGETELEMRGMSSAGGNSSTVGFYLGDTPLTAPAAAQNGKVVIDPSLYDLARIEVLRGPQGTLYGSGSMGGTIRLVPNAPDSSAFAASSELILGGTDGGDTLDHSENAMVNLPLVSNTMALRIVGSLENQSGWIDRLVIAQPDFPAPLGAATRANVAAAPVAQDYHDVNDESLRTVRAAILWQPIERLSIEPSVLYQSVTQGGLSDIDSNPGTNAHYEPYDISEPFEDRIDLGSLNVKFHFDFADLISSASYWTRDEDLRQDGTEDTADAVGAPIYPAEWGMGPISPAALEDDKSQQWSDETRLVSTGDTALKWLVGYFYQDFESDFDEFAYTPLTAIPGTIPNAFTQYQPTKLLQNSLFGEVSYTFLRQLTATAGLRRYYYHGSVNDAVSGWLSSSGTDAFDHFATGERDSGVTPKFNLADQLTKNLLVYGTAAEGFRPGGGNQPIPTAGALGAQCLLNLESFGLSSAPLGFNPDNVWSYELGEKYGDSRLRVNSATYFEHWEHIQQNIPLACGFPFTGNAGDAHIYGAELEVSALLMPGLVAAANGGWTHAQFVANAVPGSTIDERVQNVPQITASASLTYRRGLTEEFGLLARIDNVYVGSRIDTTAQANYLPPYDLTNMRAGLEGDNWSATLFVNNATNRRALLTDTPSITVNSPLYNRIAVEQPLTFGIDLSYQFGGSRP